MTKVMLLIVSKKMDSHFCVWFGVFLQSNCLLDSLLQVIVGSELMLRESYIDWNTSDLWKNTVI